MSLGTNFKTSKKLYAFVTGFTIIIMYITISYVNNEYPKILQHKFWGILFSLVISTGLFTSISTTIVYFFEKIKWVKSFILGSNYLEGIWVGFVENPGNEKAIKNPSYIVEKITQNFTDIYISGNSYKLINDSFVKTSTWKSSVAKLNEKHKTLEYTYTCWTTDPNDKGKQFTGFATFNYENLKHKMKLEKYPLIKGFSIWGTLNDFDPSNRLLIGKEIKISDEPVQEIDYFANDAFEYTRIVKDKMKLHIP